MPRKSKDEIIAELQAEVASLKKQLTEARLASAAADEKRNKQQRYDMDYVPYDDDRRR